MSVYPPHKFHTAQVTRKRSTRAPSTTLPAIIPLVLCISFPFNIHTYIYIFSAFFRCIVTDFSWHWSNLSRSRRQRNILPERNTPPEVRSWVENVLLFTSNNFSGERNISRMAGRNIRRRVAEGYLPSVNLTRGIFRACLKDGFFSLGKLKYYRNFWSNNFYKQGRNIRQLVVELFPIAQFFGGVRLERYSPSAEYSALVKDANIYYFFPIKTEYYAVDGRRTEYSSTFLPSVRNIPRLGCRKSIYLLCY